MLTMGNACRMNIHKDGWSVSEFVHSRCKLDQVFSNLGGLV